MKIYRRGYSITPTATRKFLPYRLNSLDLYNFNILISADIVILWAAGINSISDHRLTGSGRCDTSRLTFGIFYHIISWIINDCCTSMIRHVDIADGGDDGVAAAPVESAVVEAAVASADRSPRNRRGSMVVEIYRLIVMRF